MVCAIAWTLPQITNKTTVQSMRSPSDIFPISPVRRFYFVTVSLMQIRLCKLTSFLLSFELRQTLRNTLGPVVHRVLSVAPLERCGAFETHTAGALIDRLGQQSTAD